MPRIFLLVLLLAAPWALPGSNDNPIDRATLKGLKAVSVVIDPIASAELQSRGITVGSLQSQVEAQLRSAHVPVDASAVEFLGLRISYAQASRTTGAVCLSLSLYQPVLLSRDHSVRTVTDTWGTSSLRLIQQKAVKQAISDSVVEMVGWFVGAYSGANGAPPPGR